MDFLSLFSKELLSKPLLLAPMDDITDFPFRLMARRLGADIVCTEFTSCEALIRHVDKAKEKIRVRDEERPVGIQIFGANEQSMAEAIRIVEQFRPDFIDINCGCCAKRHSLRGEGAGLLLDLPLLEKILKTVVKATSLPVTIKTRLGWDHKNMVILDVAKMAEQAGIKAITVHGRTRVQAYKGAADWSWFGKIKKVVSIPVIGNGDVANALDAMRVFETGCDGVMIGRAAILNPWLFQEIKYYREHGTLPAPPSLAERIEKFLEHLGLVIAIRGEHYGLIHFRKHYSGYLRRYPNISRVRFDLMELKTFTEIRDYLNRLNLG